MSSLLCNLHQQPIKSYSSAISKGKFGHTGTMKRLDLFILCDTFCITILCDTSKQTRVAGTGILRSLIQQF